MSELLPCPFCGWHTLNIQASSMFRVACPYCDMAGPLMSNKEAAIGTWNALPHALRWAKERPTTPGWYWVRFDKEEVRMLEIRRSWLKTLQKITEWEWAGPIPEPKEE